VKLSAGTVSYIQITCGLELLIFGEKVFCVIFVINAAISNA